MGRPNFLRGHAHFHDCYMEKFINGLAVAELLAISRWLLARKFQKPIAKSQKPLLLRSSATANLFMNFCDLQTRHISLYRVQKR